MNEATTILTFTGTAPTNAFRESKGIKEGNTGLAQEGKSLCIADQATPPASHAHLFLLKQSRSASTGDAGVDGKSHVLRLNQKTNELIE